MNWQLGVKFQVACASETPPPPFTSIMIALIERGDADATWATGGHAGVPAPELLPVAGRAKVPAETPAIMIMSMMQKQDGTCHEALQWGSR